MPRPSKKRSSSRLMHSFRAMFSADTYGSAARAMFEFAWRAAVLLLIWGTVIGGSVIAYYAYDMPDISQVTQPQRRPAITLLADDGTVFKRYGDLYGQRVTINDVPPNLIHAILAIEDRRFYSHFGVDLIGLLRAFVQNVRAGHVVQGGSTLTQQLAKNLFLTPQRTTRRKVQEMLLAFWLERTYSKDQILTAYLNRVYLGSGAYGVDAAADVYFGKPVSALNLKECAIMAGLLRAPSRYAPTNDYAQSVERAKTVLGAMVEVDYITEAEKQNAVADVPVPRRKPGAGGDGHYYADWIVDQVQALLENAPQDITVLTTIDLKMQMAAERKLDGMLAAEGAAKKVEEGALVSMSPDGAVRAMVGGRDYGESQFNRATQAMRQPGSSFKPIIYLAAILEGLTPNDIYEDSPITIGKCSPENYDQKYRGPITARQALAESVNTVAVRVMQKVGVSKVIETARALGITSDLENNMSLALGTNSVTPLEMTGVYAALATGGRAVTPYGIKEVRSREGKVLYHRDEVTLPATVNPQAVATLVDMMTDVVRYGTGKAATLDRPVAGKTGTSSDYRDAWFLGFTGNYITGVWFGNDDNKPMKKVTGGNLPAQLWHAYMVEAEAGKPATPLFAGMPMQAPTSDAPLVIEGTAPSKPVTTDTLGAFIRDLTKGMPTEVEHSYPEDGR